MTADDATDTNSKANLNTFCQKAMPELKRECILNHKG